MIICFFIVFHVVYSLQTLGPDAALKIFKVVEPSSAIALVGVRSTNVRVDAILHVVRMDVAAKCAGHFMLNVFFFLV